MVGGHQRAPASPFERDPIHPVILVVNSSSQFFLKPVRLFCTAQVGKRRVTGLKLLPNLLIWQVWIM